MSFESLSSPEIPAPVTVQRNTPAAATSISVPPPAAPNVQPIKKDVPPSRRETSQHRKATPPTKKDPPPTSRNDVSQAPASVSEPASRKAGHEKVSSPTKPKVANRQDPVGLNMEDFLPVSLVDDRCFQTASNNCVLSVLRKKVLAMNITVKLV